MKMMDEQIEKITANIKDMKNGSYEQMVLITLYSLSSYFKSLITFGQGSNVTRDNLNIIKEMFNILKKERQLLIFILKHIEEFEVEAVCNVVYILDDLNDKTVEYYYNVIEDIEDAVFMKEERRGIRPRKNFPTLIQSDSYTKEVIALTETKDNVKNFLGFEDDFWQYIEKHEYSVRTTPELAQEMAYVTYLVDENHIVTGMKLLVPDVVDLSTALLAIKLYQQAYDIYKMIGSKYDSHMVGDYTEKQVKYQNEYLFSEEKINLKKKKLK